MTLVLFKTLLHMDSIFQNLLIESIYHANNVPDIPFRNSSAIFDVEKDMYYTFSRILARFFQNYPEKTNISFENINNLSDIYPVLKQKLQDEIKLDKLFRLRGQLSIIGILPMPYQCYVLKCIIVTGKFALKYMKQFKNEDAEIFNIVLNTMLDFLKETHISQIMHPFGTVERQETKEKVDELCCQFENIL